MTSADFEARWPRFSKRLSAALKHDGRALRREGVRLQISMSVCSQAEGATVLNAAVTLIHNGLRRGSVAGLHVTGLPERGKECSLTSLAHELTAAAADWLRKEPPLGHLPVFVYP